MRDLRVHQVPELAAQPAETLQCGSRDQLVNLGAVHLEVQLLFKSKLAVLEHHEESVLPHTGVVSVPI